ncbi:hypothetical protein [Actinophytocola sp.]|uniref:hypothetical protein n=1 Tax=Actinophytocola sp. TaxID=1872138 RepID=UPI00389A242C
MNRLLDAVASLDVPDPFDIDELVRRVAVRRGRPITLRALRIGPGGPSGLWLAVRDADLICYEAGTNAVHQAHIVLHELGHVLCGHDSAGTSPDSVLRFLLPTLDPAAVSRVLRRGAYHDEEEREAERFATLVRQRAGRLPVLAPTALAARDEVVLRRIEAALRP